VLVVFSYNKQRTLRSEGSFLCEIFSSSGYFPDGHGNEQNTHPAFRFQILLQYPLHSIKTEDTLVALLEFENGAIGTIQATTSVYPGFQRKLSICGTEGTIVLCEDAIETCVLKNNADAVQAAPAASNVQTGSRPDGMDFSLHRRQLSDFVSSLLKGERPFMDAPEGKKAVEIICAIYESARTGEKVFLQNKAEASVSLRKHPMTLQS